VPPDAWWPAGQAGITAGRVALSTGITVRVVHAGPERGEPVVLVHGWGIHSYLWRRTIPALVTAGYRVHALDLPGHGLSDRPLAPGSYALGALTQHLAATFDALAIQRAAVAGQSMGGRIAVELALTQPDRVRSLVLFGSVGFGEVPATVSLAPYLPAPRGALSTLLVQRWMVALSKAFAYGRRSSVAQDDVDAYWATTQFPDFLAAIRQALIDFDWRPLTPRCVARLAAPTLVVFGTRDRTVRPVHAEELVRSLPRGTLRWIRDAGHVANEEAADEVNPLLVDFIAGGNSG
jgi:pimeloyl-ACP methyl ester carboxylesterase